MTGLFVTIVVLQSFSLMVQLASYNVASETRQLLHLGARRAGLDRNDNA